VAVEQTLEGREVGGVEPAQCFGFEIRREVAAEGVEIKAPPSNAARMP
jgi:hypothetical protein